MFKQTLILLICFSYSCSFAQKDVYFIKNWNTWPIPTKQDSLALYNNSPNNWVTKLDNGEVCVSQRSDESLLNALPFKIPSNRKQQISIFPVEDGYLIGFYRGEWGGNLDWYSKNGKEHYKISDDMVIQFVKKNNLIFAIQGLAHLSISEGSIINVKKVNGKWISIEYLKLPAAPFAVTLNKHNEFVLITEKSLLKITSDKKIIVLIKNGFWHYLNNPNSIVVLNNVAYAGMRAGVYKFNLSTGVQNWLMP